MLNEKEKQDIINIFLLWLTESGVMTPFRKDIEKVEGVRDKEGFEKLIKKNILDHPNTSFERGLNNMLNLSFSWADSSNGFDYWDDTDCDYRKSAEDYYIRYQINHCSTS